MRLGAMHSRLRTSQSGSVVVVTLILSLQSVVIAKPMEIPCSWPFHIRSWIANELRLTYIIGYVAYFLIVMSYTMYKCMHLTTIFYNMCVHVNWVRVPMTTLYCVCMCKGWCDTVCVCVFMCEQVCGYDRAGTYCNSGNLCVVKVMQIG